MTLGPVRIIDPGVVLLLLVDEVIMCNNYLMFESHDSILSFMFIIKSSR